MERQTDDEHEQQCELPRSPASETAAEHDEHHCEQADARHANQQERTEEIGLFHVAVECTDGEERDRKPAEDAHPAMAAGEALEVEARAHGVALLDSTAGRTRCGPAS